MAPLSPKQLAKQLINYSNNSAYRKCYYSSSIHNLSKVCLHICLCQLDTRQTSRDTVPGKILPTSLILSWSTNWIPKEGMLLSNTGQQRFTELQLLYINGCYSDQILSSPKLRMQMTSIKNFTTHLLLVLSSQGLTFCNSMTVLFSNNACTKTTINIR